MYDTVRLTHRIISPVAEQLYPAAREHIFANTRQVVIQSGLDRALTTRFLDRMRKLKSIRFICYLFICDTSSPHGMMQQIRRQALRACPGPNFDCWVPSDIYSGATGARNPLDMDMHLAGFPVGALDGENAALYWNAIPFGLVRSLETEGQPDGGAGAAALSDLTGLRRLLVATPLLKKLHLRGTATATRFRFGPGERMPPLEELSLMNYDWAHEPYETKLFWDFSRLRTLELLSCPTYKFFSSLRSSDMRRVESLLVDDLGAEKKPHRRQAATMAVREAIVDRIERLQRLRLVCSLEHWEMDALVAHRASLRELVLRDHEVFGFRFDHRVPALSVRQLRTLSRRLHRLESLEVDLNALDGDSAKALKALCRFPQLHTLTLHVPTTAGSGTWYCRSGDPDGKSAERIFKLLTRRKVGAARWTRVTIVVHGFEDYVEEEDQEEVEEQGGGPLVRNRERNHYAERCFVLDIPANIDHDAHGRIDMAPLGSTGWREMVREDEFVETRFMGGHPWLGL